ncbi:hypothetical protein LS684_02705 [Cytobacillus spongiae]|uniref:hypothetical protein n=1 Tax=Cytobacillus spongiae TaxID=2901381 RepID=UPI001F43E797|nr:hypothetical protein [Cytobacillus spongiae]UII56414.1 hypothetical protein LS684_02705 [Cytobacillus spongiae]
MNHVDKQKLVLIVGLLLTVSGIVMLFNCVSFGTSLASGWLAEQGGAASETYHIVISSYIESFLVAGGIFLGFGLLFGTIFIYRGGLHQE